MTYTQLVIAAAIVVIVLDLVVLQTRLLLRRRFWIFFAVMSLFFLVVNGILTGLPVVIYSSDAIIGLRIGSIPVEDVAYLFALITPVIAIYEWMIDKHRRGRRSEEPEERVSS